MPISFTDAKADAIYQGAIPIGDSRAPKRESFAMDKIGVLFKVNH